jgi:hypothetical protein
MTALWILSMYVLTGFMTAVSIGFALFVVEAFASLFARK